MEEEAPSDQLYATLETKVNPTLANFGDACQGPLVDL